MLDEHQEGMQDFKAAIKRQKIKDFYKKQDKLGSILVVVILIVFLWKVFYGN